MIKKLQRKFIAAAMISLFIVLTLIISAINISNFQSIANTADGTLSLLAQNGGRFPIFNRPDMPNAPSERPMSPEMPYETRFFSVTVSSTDGTVQSTDTEQIAAIDRAEAVSLATQILHRGSFSGFTGNYRYTVLSSDGYNQVIFLDCTRELTTFKTFLFTSCGISLLGFLAVFIMLVLLSRRIVRPVSESYEKQKQFITDAGHEIKTPITVIDADAEVLEMELGDNEWLQDIRNQAARLTSLTNDLIYLSRMQEDNLKLQLIDFPVSDVVEEAAQSFSSVAVTQKKRILGNIQPMLSFTGDEKAIRQLISILLDNALKYSPENSDISLDLYKSGKTLVLSVSNISSQPVKKDELAHLFDRFYRSDKSRNSALGGYGIGLSIAKAITDSHKGRIVAASPDGSTIIFTVTLPI